MVGEAFRADAVTTARRVGYREDVTRTLLTAVATSDDGKKPA
jgi:hypothetical protein